MNVVPILPSIHPFIQPSIHTSPTRTVYAHQCHTFAKLLQFHDLVPRAHTWTMSLRIPRRGFRCFGAKQIVEQVFCDCKNYQGSMIRTSQRMWLFGEHHPFIGNAEVYFRQCIIDPFCTFTVLICSFVKRFQMQILYPENLQPVTPDIHLSGFIHAYRRVFN